MSGAYSAVLPRGVQLWKKREIAVFFTYKTIPFLEKWGQEMDDILKKANRWHLLQEEPNYIPKFKSCTGVKGADIIVELNGIRILLTQLRLYLCMGEGYMN